MKLHAAQLLKAKEECGKTIEILINLEDQNIYEEILHELLQEQDVLSEELNFYMRFMRNEISYEFFRNSSLKVLKMWEVFPLNFLRNLLFFYREKEKNIQEKEEKELFSAKSNKKKEVYLRSESDDYKRTEEKENDLVNLLNKIDSEEDKAKPLKINEKNSNL